MQKWGWYERLRSVICSLLERRKGARLYCGGVPFLVPDSLKLVDDNEEVDLLVGNGPQKLLSGKGEVVLGGNYEDDDDDDDLLLTGKGNGGLDAIQVEARGINQRYVDDAVVKE